MTKFSLLENISPQVYEKWLLSLPNAPFLQSKNMRHLHQSLGDQAFLFGFQKEQELIGLAFAVLVKARRGHYLYLPYGPVFKRGGWQYLPEFTSCLRQKGLALKADFLRISPFLVNHPQNQELLKNCGWQKAPIHMLAEHLWLLDISISEEQIWKGMRKTMRNLIHRAQRDGVKIIISQDLKEVEHLVRVHKDTVKQHKFVPYGDDYFRAQFKAFAPDKQVAMFLAQYQNKIIAACMIMFYGGMASYHHSGALNAYRKIPASYLLQWEAIREAKRRKCLTYNFWGIVPPAKLYSPYLKRPHPFNGVTKFKTGFGGSRLDLIHCQDYPLSWKYNFNYLVETVRRIKRGFY
ncbi:MAG: hypothetical protein A2233_00260 [Candidatus Kerfeldbacteria bacterium RIFOXYA2_FULL_38_24]|uniref:BioF2-like acetyltransferase domain-containing protein n=1 Tax=Candidatus Kerfeldbacteria bacterium RIFOXYB2_FULL_38_14 TaxID=1798547 RepID=A0A1G2B9Z5_9BACT|nr:MAG: hypothetical protein A2233_00260 [Candidatus Kerfeldbacteria bacterium RIFOXYA2_FULL_38_24]OGY86028.1 MAG: hypothetical protein A2319_00465 [Candidatus Kerfeldbacteria bacterium RIFOXYB2_FULL_38_14]OGY89481.1 MAG: hypothetical protein A2458_02675 [Candidatus Kerfeldbacteria bacterium RIFOXYC2_FULL_38_9]